MKPIFKLTPRNTKEDKLSKRIVKLRLILSSMKCSGYETDKKLIANLRWFEENLKVHNENHKDYKKAINLIKAILYAA